MIQATNPRLFLLGLALFQRERKAMTEIAVNSGIRKTWFYNLYCLKLSVYPSTNSNYAECFFSVLLFFRSIFGSRRIVFKGTWHLAWFNYHITKFIIAKWRLWHITTSLGKCFLSCLQDSSLVGQSVERWCTWEFYVETIVFD